MSRSRWSKGVVVASVLSASFIVGAAGQAKADDPPVKKKPLSAACVAATKAYKHAVESQKSGHLRDAVEAYRECQESTCGSLAATCATKSTQLCASMPSVVPLVTDEQGAPKVDVEVKMDQATLTSHLDGKGIPVDPGVHEFTFSDQGGKVFATQKVMIVEGQRNRAIAVNLRGDRVADTSAASSEVTAPASEPTEKPASAPKAATEAVASEKTSDKSDPGSDAEVRRKRLGPSPWAWTAGGVAVASIAAGAVLTYWGNRDNDKLSQCRPTCPSTSVTHIKTLYVASDVTYGVGAVAAGLAVWLFATPRYAEEKVGTKSTKSRTSYVFDVAPTPSGAFGSISGTF
jgi:hypothetical protein